MQAVVGGAGCGVAAEVLQAERHPDPGGGEMVRKRWYRQQVMQTVGAGGPSAGVPTVQVYGGTGRSKVPQRQA